MSAADRIVCRFSGDLAGFRLNAAFEAPTQGVTALFGPSGCGKTSVLRCMAGLRKIADGHCEIGGQVWQSRAAFVPPWKRAVGYVFQESSLFAHLSVWKNLLYGAPRSSRADARGDAAFDEVVDLLGLEKFIDRMPRHLSGGERQRVAVGRALLSAPRLLLMDEPLSALDEAAKSEILPFFDRLRARAATPIIYVSHDMSEVERLADHIVLMDAGRVVASGPLRDIQADTSLPLARAREASVSLEAEVADYDAAYGLAHFRVAGGLIIAPSPAISPGETRRLRIGAGDISLALAPPVSTTILNLLPARVVSATPLDASSVLVALRLGVEGEGARVIARVTRRSLETLGLREGARVIAQIKGVSLALK